MNQVLCDQRPQFQNDESYHQQFMENFDRIYKAIRDFVNSPVEFDQNMIAIQQKEFHDILTFYLENSQQSSSLNNYSQTLNILHSQLFTYIRRSYGKLQKTREQQIKFCIRSAIKFQAAQLMEQQQIKLKRVAHRQLINKYIKNENQKQRKFMNHQFLKHLFSSQQFRQDFEQFLGIFDNYPKINLNQLLKKLIQEKQHCQQVRLIFRCNMQSNQSQSKPIFQITTRMPWTTSEIQEAISIGKCLLQQFNCEDMKSNQNSTSLI